MSPCLLVLFCSFLFLYRLGSRELSSSHEARAAQNAQSIVSEDDWLLPQLFDRRVELQKPPLYYWLVALLGRLAGGAVGAWAVRLPAALAALATVLTLYLFCRARGRPLAGLVAASVLATCWHFTWLARVGRIDMPLTLCVTVTVLGFTLGMERLREGAGRSARTYLPVAYLAIAAGLLLKGPIALVLPGVVALARLATSGGAGGRPWLKRARALGLWWGVPLVGLLAGPWYVLAGLATRGDFLRVFLWHHNLDRGLAVDGALHSHPWWFYGPRLAADLLPWSLALPVAAWLFCRRREWRRDPLAVLGLAWLAGILGLLSCMSFKRADYLLPAYPGAALFLGCIVEHWWREWDARARLRLALGFGLVLATCAVGWGIHANQAAAAAQANPIARFASAIRRATAGPVLFFRTEQHELAWHVGRPLDSLVEWENLDVWLARPGPVHVVMPAACAEQWPGHLRNGRLVEVLRSGGLTAHPTGQPLVLLRGRRAADAPRPRS